MFVMDDDQGTVEFGKNGWSFGWSIEVLYFYH